MRDSWSEDDEQQEESLFTPEKVKIIGEVHDLLGKHFDAYVLVTYVESDDLKREQARCSYHDGRIQAKGLLHEGLKILDQ